MFTCLMHGAAQKQGKDLPEYGALPAPQGGFISGIAKLQPAE